MGFPYMEMKGCFSQNRETPRYFEKQNAFYEANKERLIAKHPFKYVAVYEKEIGGVYDTFDAAFNAHKDMVLDKECTIRRVDPPLSYFIPDWKELGYINGDR